MELEKPKPVGQVAEPGSAADPGANAGSEGLPTLEHLGSVEDLEEIPSFLLPERPTPAAERAIKQGRYSCAYCGVGDSAQVDVKPASRTLPVLGPEHGQGELKLERFG